MKNLVEYILESESLSLEKLAKKYNYDENIYGTVVGSDDDSHTTWIIIGKAEYPYQKRKGGDYTLSVVNRTVNMAGENPFLKISKKAQDLWKEVESIGYKTVDDAHKAALKYIKEFDKILK